MTKTVLLGDLVDINSESINKNYPYNKIVYLDTSSVTENQFSKLEFLKLSEAPSRAKRVVRDGDTVISTVRPNLKHYGYIKNPDQNMIASTGFAVVRPKAINSKYLYYWLTSPINTNYFSTIADSQTSTFPAFNPSIINKLSIKLPTDKEQELIGNFLFYIDEKIELNRRINETLEKIAQTLFKHYFINNPEAKTWPRVTLSDISERIGSGGTPSTNREDFYNGNIDWFSTKELNDNFLKKSNKTITDEGLNNSAAKLFPVETVVIAIYAAPTVGRLGILTREGSFNQAACGLVANQKYGYEFTYLYLLFSRKELNDQANGAAQQNISVGAIRTFPVFDPPEELLNEFREQISNIFKQIRIYTDQTQSLVVLRDLLLPRLISGKITL